MQGDKFPCVKYLEYYYYTHGIVGIFEGFGDPVREGGKVVGFIYLWEDENEGGFAYMQADILSRKHTYRFIRKIFFLDFPWFASSPGV